MRVQEKRRSARGGRARPPWRGRLGRPGRTPGTASAGSHRPIRTLGLQTARWSLADVTGPRPAPEVLSVPAPPPSATPTARRPAPSSPSAAAKLSGEEASARCGPPEARGEPGLPARSAGGDSLALGKGSPSSRVGLSWRIRAARGSGHPQQPLPPLWLPPAIPPPPPARRARSGRPPGRRGRR